MVAVIRLLGRTGHSQCGPYSGRVWRMLKGLQNVRDIERGFVDEGFEHLLKKSSEMMKVEFSKVNKSFSNAIHPIHLVQRKSLDFAGKDVINPE
jgi:hypothetical protein